MRSLLICFLLILIQNVVFAASDEQNTFSRARQLFEMKKFNEALIEYNKIPQKSDRYLLALEEKAWTYIHLDQYDKALAAARTLTSPALSGLTTTEPFLLKAIVQLKICDYVGVFQTLNEFKTQKKEQIIAIQDLAKKRQNTVSRLTLEKWMQNTDDWKNLGPALAQMPQLFYKDKIMLLSAKQKSMSKLEKRLQELAIIENNENHRILQKLNLIEVEGVQRVHIASQFNDKQGETLEKNKDDLVFKDSKDDLWLDELDSYQATIDRCQKKSGRTM
jgi:hypothetical protein